MGTITYMSLVDRAKIVLRDADHDRWSLEELLDWIADAERAVARLRPDSTSLHTDIVLNPGTRQSLPDEAYRLITITRNVGGGAVTPVDRNVIDAQNRSWHQDPPADEIDHFIYDDRDPKSFYVWPPAQESASVEAVISVMPVPPQIVAGNEALIVGDEWAEPVLDRTLWRAFSKDAASSPSNAARAASHLAAFNEIMGVVTQTDSAMSPNNGNT